MVSRPRGQNGLVSLTSYPDTSQPMTLSLGAFWFLLLAVCAITFGALRLRVAGDEPFEGSRRALPVILAGLPRCYAVVYNVTYTPHPLPTLLRISPEPAGDRFPELHWYAGEARRAGVTSPAWWAELDSDSLDVRVPDWPIGVRMRLPSEGAAVRGRVTLSDDVVSDWVAIGEVRAAIAPCPGTG